MFICKSAGHGFPFSSGDERQMLGVIEQSRRQGASTTAGILSFAGWIPHFRMFVWGCLCLVSGLDVSAT